MSRKNNLVFVALLSTVILFTSLVTYFSVAMFGEIANKKSVIVYQDFRNTELNVKLHIFKTRAELNEAIAPFLKDNDHDSRDAFSVWDHTGRCEIYVTEVYYESEFEAWGHELAHCVYGQWHKKE